VVGRDDTPGEQANLSGDQSFYVGAGDTMLGQLLHVACVPIKVIWFAIQPGEPFFGRWVGDQLRWWAS
jgi:hypothetical protein